MLTKSSKPNFKGGGQRLSLHWIRGIWLFREFYGDVPIVNIAIISKILLTMPQKIRFIETESTQKTFQVFFDQNR
jgi:hypothetical protein